MFSSGKLTSTGIDTVALQEASINFLGKTVALWGWIPVYPSTHEREQRKTRAVTLMTSKIPTENWEQLKFQSEDIEAEQKLFAFALPTGKLTP